MRKETTNEGALKLFAGLSLLLASSLITLLASNCCYAFDPGFYRYEPEVSEILKIEQTADRVLRFRGLDRIDIGVGEGDDKTGRAAVNFTRAQVHNFLANERHKNMLVMWFYYPDSQQLTELKSFAGEFGYKRVLILSWNFAGVSVVYDSSEIQPTQVPQK